MNFKQKLHYKHEYRIIGASAIGPSHVTSAMPCQDAFSYKVMPSGIGVIAVADGLGSSLLSDFGARDAAETAVFSVKQNVSSTVYENRDLKDIASKAVFFAREVLGEKTEEYQCKLRDLACTLIVLVMHEDSVAVAHIGDGAVIADTIDGLKLISPPEDSEYINEVSPITDKEWEKHLRVTPVIYHVFGIMAFTDGLQRAALVKKSDGFIPFEGFCGPLFSYVKEAKYLKEAENDIRSLLSSKKVCENSDDDKTLVIATITMGS